MVINFNPKYIPGDIVYNHKKEIIRITSSYLKGTKLFYYRDGECGWIREDAIKPIPLTPEILEKNGWRTQNRRYYYLNVAEGLISYIGIDFKHKSNKGHLYVEVDGKLVKDESVSFINDDHIVRTIQRIVQPLGRTIDAVNPMVDARLRDGSRLNAIIPPLSLTGPVITIRKFSKTMNSVDDLLRMGSLTAHMALFLQACVRAKLNIIISGGTGTGKTTLLNILSGFIDDEERIITIEDAAELKLHQSHVISLETRMVNYEGEGEITIRDLVRNSLRMRPDRIIVGEVRGKEAFDMLQAMNTGHEGSITTLHANSPEDAINRLETMMLMNDMELPVSAIRNYIEKAINIVVQIERLSDGKRKITSISEIVGIKDGKVNLKEIFAFRENGVSNQGSVLGEFVVYKQVPKVYNIMKRKGIILEDMFGE